MSLGGVFALFDNTGPAIAALVAGGIAAKNKMTSEVEDAVKAAFPYAGDQEVEATKNDSGDIEFSPWWLGFVEFGTVYQSAKPFAGPASDQIFNRASSYFMGLEALL
jgi:hypothetical protein